MSRRSESDVPEDPHVAGARDTGGREVDGEPDKHSTTGTTRDDSYVGRVSGEDAGYAEETGAEARARTDDDETPAR